ncbi:hypothetical protein HNY73_013385 [Argiope bruennichi]|uniref:Uncharacterized protein n=1 Tax=Argiope bruennichi TaxID=94029 RepID=A0A8T0F2K2_ARGBR|nr:hypothetical protein HNY73_013385 [Argiope bruennichi]
MLPASQKKMGSVKLAENEFGGFQFTGLTNQSDSTCARVSPEIEAPVDFVPQSELQEMHNSVKPFPSFTANTLHLQEIALLEKFLNIWKDKPGIDRTTKKCMFYLQKASKQEVEVCFLLSEALPRQPYIKVTMKNVKNFVIYRKHENSVSASH